MKELLFVFDGLADTSIYLTNTLDDLLGMIGSRLGSMLRSRRQFLMEKLDPLINKALAALPTNLPIDDDLYLALEMPRSIETAKDKYLSIPLNVTLQSKAHPFPIANTETLPDVSSTGYQLELFLTEYFANSLFY